MAVARSRGWVSTGVLVVALKGLFVSSEVADQHLRGPPDADAAVHGETAETR